MLKQESTFDIGFQEAQEDGFQGSFADYIDSEYDMYANGRVRANLPILDQFSWIEWQESGVAKHPEVTYG